MTKDEALEQIAGFTLSQFMGPNDMALACVDVARKALEQPEHHPKDDIATLPEPVAVVDANDEGYWADILPDRSVKVGQLLYTSPPKREWQGLSDDEIDQGLLRSNYAFKTAEAWHAGVVFAMTKLKEKNT